MQHTSMGRWYGDMNHDSYREIHWLASMVQLCRIYSIWGPQFCNGFLPATPPLERSEILRTPFTIDVVGLLGELQHKSRDGSAGSMILVVVVVVVAPLGSNSTSILHNSSKLALCIRLRISGHFIIKHIHIQIHVHIHKYMHGAMSGAQILWHRNPRRGHHYHHDHIRINYLTLNYHWRGRQF